jgi:glutathione S-transferase
LVFVALAATWAIWRAAEILFGDARLAERAQAAFVTPQLKLHMNYWESELQRSTWFAGEEFTSADIMMSFPFEVAAVRAHALQGRPKLAAFLERIRARPAYQRAVERGGAFDVVR